MLIRDAITSLTTQFGAIHLLGDLLAGEMKVTPDTKEVIEQEAPLKYGPELVFVLENLEITAVPRDILLAMGDRNLASPGIVDVEVTRYFSHKETIGLIASLIDGETIVVNDALLVRVPETEDTYDYFENVLEEPVESEDVGWYYQMYWNNASPETKALVSMLILWMK